MIGCSGYVGVFAVMDPLRGCFYLPGPGRGNEGTVNSSRQIWRSVSNVTNLRRDSVFPSHVATNSVTMIKGSPSPSGSQDRAERTSVRTS